jgi:magnesium transporter
MIRINSKTGGESELRTLEKIEPGSWIDVTAPTEKEIEQLKYMGIPADYIKSALDEDERPRCERENGTVLIIFRVPATKMVGGMARTETLPLSVVILKDIIVTIGPTENEVTKDFYDNKVKNFATKKRTRFLIQILSRANRHFMKHLDVVEKKIAEVDVRLLKAIKNEEIIGLFGLQKTMVYFNAAVIGNGKVLESVMKGRTVKLFEGDEEILENIIIENEQAVEMVSVYNAIISETLDAYTSIVSNNLNVVMKVMTSLTIILSLPVIVSSFYGMNVKIPNADDPYAYLFVMVVSFVISFTCGMIFLKKRWL